MRKKTFWIGCACSVILALTACGRSSVFNTSSSSTTMETYAVAEQSMTDTAEDFSDFSMSNFSTDAGGGIEQQADRKLIKTVSMDVETEEFDTLLNSLQTRIEGLGGYIEDSDVRGNTYDSERYRYADYTIRVPSERLEELVENVTEIANVTWKNENVQDITLQYIDTESHKLALQTEQERLLELMEQAETVEDLIAIESRLSEIRYQMQSYESTLRLYDNQVNYSTLYLNISEVKKLTPQEKPSAWSRITEGFLENVGSVGKDIQNLVIELIIAIPYLIVWGIILFVVYRIGKKIIKKKKKISS